MRYCVSADLSIVVYVEAENEDEAEEKGDAAIAKAWDALFDVDLPDGAAISGRYDETDVSEAE